MGDTILSIFYFVVTKHEYLLCILKTPCVVELANSSPSTFTFKAGSKLDKIVKSAKNLFFLSLLAL